MKLERFGMKAPPTLGLMSSAAEPPWPPPKEKRSGCYAWGIARLIPPKISGYC